MPEIDAQLGEKVKKHLVEKGVETPLNGMSKYASNDISVQAARKSATINATRLVLESLSLDLNDDSLKDTPKRLAKMYHDELFWGLDYNKFPKCTVIDNKYSYKEMVIRKGISIKSMCEHHFMPIDGQAIIAYIPDEKVIGLSKLDRLAEFFARRPQVQERMTEQIAHCLAFVLGTEDVAVIINAKHFCVSHRGVGNDNSDTITSKLLGKFFTVPTLRAEFLSLGAKS